MEIERRVRRAVFPLLRFLLPSYCFCCRRPLPAYQQLGACADCWGGLRPMRLACGRCALPISESTDLLGPAGGCCARCLLARPPVDGICAALAYDERARRFLLRAKIGLRRELLPEMGRLLASRVHRFDPAAGCRVIVPLPSHPWNRLRRGFWPSLELARVVGRSTGLPVRSRALAYGVPSGGPAKHLGRAARGSLSRRAFRVRGRLDGLQVLLVDDVMTTGSSLFSSACLLKAAGAERVVGAVWARTLAKIDTDT